MTYPFQTIIEGKIREIIGMDTDGKYLLDRGEKLWIKSLKRESFRALTLTGVAKLTFTDGEWLLDGKNLKAWIGGATLKRHEISGDAHTKLSNLARLHEELEVLSEENWAKVKGVASFGEHFDNVDGETAESCAVTNDDLAALTTSTSHVKRRPVPAAREFRPVLLTDYQVINRPQAGAAKSYKTASNLLKSAAHAAANQIQTATRELRASTEQLAEVAQPFREMYKDQRLAGAKSDALRAGIPELVVDVIVGLYHTSKMPTTDGLLKYLNDSGFANQLGSTGHGTSRATVGRWLTDFKKIMRRRGLMQAARVRHTNAIQNPTANSKADNFQIDPTSTDTRTQELPEGTEPTED